MLARKVACSVLWVAVLGQMHTALADLSQSAQFNIEPQSLQGALNRYSVESGVQVADPSDLARGKSSIGVVGQYPTQAALTRLLTGTDLSFDRTDQNTVTLHTIAPPSPAEPALTPTALQTPSSPTPGPSNLQSPSTEGGMAEISIKAQEPRFAAPTGRDGIGRIWAPVYINGKGPYRLILDSGAGGSGVTMPVVQELGLPLDRTPPVLLRGVTGAMRVQTARVRSLAVGDIALDPGKVLVLPEDALGGAEGILDTQGFKDRRILIDFHHDLIQITRSHKERAAPGFIRVPFKLVRGQILVHARVGAVRAAAIINTGGQSTLANDAMRNALFKANQNVKIRSEQITGITADVQSGDAVAVPNISFGPIEIRQGRIVFGDMRIFQHLDLIDRPTLLIGMDTIGSFDTFVIDYKRKELQIRMRDAGTLAQAS